MHLCGIAELPDLVGPESIDAVMSDPPYAALEAYSVLAEVSAQILKPHGTLLAMSGLYHLPEVLNQMREHLDYHWTISYNLGDASQMIFPRGLATKWKPIAWFQKGSYEGPHAVDRIQGDGADKDFHVWGQDVAGMAKLVEMITPPGQIVADPYLGGGTTALAALGTDRLFIGCDADPDCVLGDGCEYLSEQLAEEHIDRADAREHYLDGFRRLFGENRPRGGLAVQQHRHVE